MRKAVKNMRLTITLMVSFVITAGGSAQHRGDNLAFQGLSYPDEVGVKALAMGGAYTSISGDINSLFYNPAGLADITQLQVTVSANDYRKVWRENQVYRPNRFFITLPFYLEGLYVPDPANNGLWDFEIFERDRDSTYVVTPPVTGKDPFSKDAADWDKTRSAFVFNNIAAAVPVTIAGKRLVVSACFSRKYDVLDFDRNDTFLDPYIGFDGYGVAERVTNDTLRMNWYRFFRDRTGTIQNITAAVAYKLNKSVNFGLGFNTFSGETREQQSLDKVGWFDLVANNRFRFSYDTLNTDITGTSKFSATSFNFGALLSLNKLSVGFNVVLPYSLERSWKYTTVVTDTLQTLASESSGIDKMKNPTSYYFGISFRPIAQFLVSFDLESTAYSKATFTLASNDTTHREWVDRNVVRFGLQYQPTKWLAFLAGYRSLPEVFVPDGAAFRDRGPAADSYTFGVSVNVLYGRFDVAYEIRRLKYYDSYFSNTNYVLETFNSLSFGYTIQL